MTDDVLTFSEFAVQLLHEVPELKPVLDEHLADNDELLRHFFLADVTRSVLEWYRRSQLQSVDSRKYGDLLARTLGFFERAMSAEDPKLVELISLSFLENLGEDRTSYLGVRRLLGRSLRRELKVYERAYGWPDSL